MGEENQSKTQAIPSKLELDVGPRIAKKIFPKIMKAWWFIAILTVIVFILIIFLVIRNFSMFWS